MTHRLNTDCAKNYCNRTLIVKVILEDVVTCFLGNGVVTVAVLLTACEILSRIGVEMFTDSGGKLNNINVI